MQQPASSHGKQGKSNVLAKFMGLDVIILPWQYNAIHSGITMNMPGRLSRCVDKPANAVGRFKGLAAGSCHFLHARCPHEQLAYNGLQIGSSVRNGFLVGSITSELRRTLCSSLNLEFRPDLAVFR